MNIPARYCTGYLSDIGTSKPWAVGDFAGWFEAHIGGHWRTFDPRNNVPRIGRVLIAHAERLMRSIREADEGKLIERELIESNNDSAAT